jgi:hypothetical protein
MEGRGLRGKTAFFVLSQRLRRTFSCLFLLAACPSQGSALDGAAMALATRSRGAGAFDVMVLTHRAQLACARLSQLPDAG